jgi:hypothetical protein
MTNVIFFLSTTYLSDFKKIKYENGFMERRHYPNLQEKRKQETEPETEVFMANP